MAKFQCGKKLEKPTNSDYVNYNALLENNVLLLFRPVEVLVKSHRFQCRMSGVPLPDRSNRSQRRQELATAAKFLRSRVAQALSCEDDPVTRYMFRHNIARIIKVCIFTSHVKCKTTLIPQHNKNRTH